MAFKFYIDTFLTDQPNNGMDLISTIKRDSLIKGVVITQDVALIWTDEVPLVSGEIRATDYLTTLFEEAICNEAELTIYDQVSNTQTNLIYTGVIKIAQLEFDEQPVSVKAKVQDNSFYSYIYNNRELKVNLRATQTKNKLPLTPIDAYQIDLFNSATGGFGSPFGAYYEGYRIFDVFEFIVAAITDNKVGFASDYLEGLGQHPFLIKGQAILNSYTLFPTAEEPIYEVSFQDVFDEIDKLKNIGFYVDKSDPENPVLRIENVEALYSIATGFSFTNLKEVVTTVDTSKLYSQVNVGSDVTVDGSDPAIYTFEEAMSYFGFRREDFFPTGQCNNGTELNLINSWVLSSNVIQDILVGASASYNDNYFLIECEGIDTGLLVANAVPWPFFTQSTPPFFYNLGLNNYNKLQRHSDKFETQFGSFLATGVEGFRALLGVAPVDDIVYMTGNAGNPNFIPPGGLTEIAEYVNETTQGGYDGGNNYDNVTTFEYTIPAPGDYSFQHLMNVEAQGLSGSFPGDTFDVYPYIALNGTALVGGTSIGTTITYDGLYQFVVNAIATAVPGDVVQAGYRIVYQPNGVGNQQVARNLIVMWNSYFECNGTPEGGIIPTSGNLSIKKLIHKFQYNISASEWVTIESNPTAMYPFEKDNITRYGWIEEINYNNWTGQANVKLISSNATI